MESEKDARRRIPSVDVLLRHAALQPALELYGRDLLRVQIRYELERVRRSLAVGSPPAEHAGLELDTLAERVAAGLTERLGRPLRRVINATGIFLHTNLGRAPLPQGVVARTSRLLDAYCDLEFSIETGKRGDRNERIDPLLCAATGGEAGILVNNNAGALVLILSSLASQRDVVVSRGELVEIGGSFRIPDILKASGVRLVEVGTTNRTNRRDYEEAVGEQTGLLLKVYPSNYRQIGFTSAVEPGELVDIGHRYGVPVAVDEGSGLLRPKDNPQLRDHPSMTTLLEKGCDIVCGSGDKLLGGPQAGIIVGQLDLVARCKQNPLYRALRPDRFTFAATEELLRMHLAGAELPIHRLWAKSDSLRSRLTALASRLSAEIVAADAFLGGGSAPERPIAGEALAFPGRSALLTALRRGTPPVIGYLHGGRLILDLRTVDPTDDETLAQAVEEAVARCAQ